MMAEYGTPIDAAIWETPLIVPMILLPARNERHGGESGPSYATRARMDAANRARAFLEQHFQIVPKPVAETGWQLGTATLQL